MNEIDALLGLGMEGPDQTQALADSLRGRKRAADIFSLSTVGNIAKGAQREQDSIMEGAQRGGVLRQAMADRQSKIDEGKLDRDSRELISGNSLKETMRNNKATTSRAWAGTKPDEYINPLTNETVTAVLTPEGLMRADGSGETLDQNLYQLRDDPNTSGYGVGQRASDRLEQTKVDKLDQRLIKYGDKLKQSNLTRAFEDISMVDDLLAQIPRNEDGSMGDIPGVGLLYNQATVGGPLAWLSEINDKEGDVGATKMRGSIQRLLNTEIRTQSGAAVTLHEMIRNRMGSGVDAISSDEDFLDFWDQIKSVLNAEQGNYDDAFGPEVTGLYNLRKAGENLTSREFIRGNYLSGEAEGLPEGMGGQMDWMMDDPSTWTEDQMAVFEAANG